MIPSKDEIKYWIKKSGHTREWLGQQCGGTSKNTVNNWLSTSIEIPASQLEIIRRLMADDTDKSKNKADPQQHLVLTVSLEDFDLWQQAALLDQSKITDYCVQAIRDACEADLRLTVVPAHPASPADEKQA